MIAHNASNCSLGHAGSLSNDEATTESLMDLEETVMEVVATDAIAADVVAPNRAPDTTFIEKATPPAPSQRNSFIVDNTPALVDDDPTRFGLVEFLASKGRSLNSLSRGGMVCV